MNYSSTWVSMMIDALPTPIRHGRGRDVQEPLDLDSLHWIEVRGMLISPVSVRTSVRDLPASVVYVAMVHSTELLHLVVNALLHGHVGQVDNATWLLEQIVRFGSRDMVVRATYVLTLIAEME